MKKEGLKGSLEEEVLPEDVKKSLRWFEDEIKELMKREDNPQAFFRALLTETELADVVRFITHDPILNPNSRPHGSRDEEILAHGQLMVMAMSLMVSRGISFEEALVAGLTNWKDADWRKREAANKQEVRGLVACPGKISGKAFLVSDDRPVEKFQGGQILVTSFLRPEDMNHLTTYRPLGIVTDNGGRLSHPAIIARELNIAAIVGTGNATKLIPHESSILVTAFGQEGTVSFLDLPSK